MDCDEDLRAADAVLELSQQAAEGKQQRSLRWTTLFTPTPHSLDGFVSSACVSADRVPVAAGPGERKDRSGRPACERCGRRLGRMKPSQTRPHPSGIGRICNPRCPEKDRSRAARRDRSRRAAIAAAAARAAAAAAQHTAASASEHTSQATLSHPQGTYQSRREERGEKKEGREERERRVAAARQR